MKSKLFLIVAPIVAVFYSCFISSSTIMSLMKMLALHKGDPEISDGVRYFVTTQYLCFALFPPIVFMSFFIREMIKTRKNTTRTNPTNSKPPGDNPYAPPASEA